MTTELQRLSSFGFMLSKQHLAEGDYEKLRQHGAELEELYSKAIEKAQRIDSSDEFTSAGKRRQKKELTATIAKELERYHRLATKEMLIHGEGPSIALELAQLRSSMKRQGDDIDPILAELRHQERRRFMLELDPVERETVIRTAAGRGDYSLLDAAVTGPQPSTTFVLDKTRTDLESKRLRAMHPQASQRIQELESAQRHLQGMVAALRSSLRKQGLFDQPEAEIEFLNQAS